jgi:RNA polymerase primary sigma factor
MRQLKISKQITNRESQSLDKYLQEIGKVDLITAEMEVELTIRIREGDHQALEKLTKANLRFVVSVAKQYQNNGMTLGDLINEGNVGLTSVLLPLPPRRARRPVGTPCRDSHQWRPGPAASGGS